jgi:hypothetical protein
MICHTHHYVKLVIALSCIFIIVACNPGNTQQFTSTQSLIEPESETQSPVENNSLTDVETTIPTEYPYPPLSTVTSMPVVEPSPTNEVSTDNDVTPIVRTELEASDPSLVMLASGKVQLVEFFAFW